MSYWIKLFLFRIPLRVFLSCWWLWWWLWLYYIRSFIGFFVPVFAYISITFVPCHKFRHSPLFMFAISRVWLRVYEADQTYLHPSFTAIQIISLPPAWLVACSFVPPAGSSSVPQAFPAISSSLSCIAHHWTTAGAEHFITAACGEKQTQTRGWAEGLRGALLVWDIPKAQVRAFWSICLRFKGANILFGDADADQLNYILIWCYTFLDIF